MSIDVKFEFHIHIAIDFMNCVSSCDFLFQRHERDSFLKRLVSRDETWILYQNVENKLDLRIIDYCETWTSCEEGSFIHLMRLKRFNLL